MTIQDLANQRVVAAIDAIRAGGMVIMVDDEDRENEGDLVFAASHVTSEKINFMTKEARGLICLSLDEGSVNRLKLPMMEDTTKRGSQKSTAFTVSIEARVGVTTGISAADRAQTIRVASDPNSGPDDIVVPGHIFPLKAKAGGVLQRAGHTEGSVDLARLAGLMPAAVICEIMNDDGSMARRSDLERFASVHKIPIVTIADMVAYRLFRESLVEEVRRTVVTTKVGDLTMILFKSLVDQQQHVALVKGSPDPSHLVDVRVHRQRSLLDALGSLGLASESRLHYGFKMLQDSQCGVLLYMTQSDPSNDMSGQFDTLTGQPPSERVTAVKPWVETDPRMLGVGAQILRHLRVKKMRVHMAVPTALKGLAGFGLEVDETVEINS